MISTFKPRRVGHHGGRRNKLPSQKSRVVGGDFPIRDLATAQDLRPPSCLDVGGRLVFQTLSQRVLNAGEMSADLVYGLALLSYQCQRAYHGMPDAQKDRAVRALAGEYALTHRRPSQNA